MEATVKEALEKALVFDMIYEDGSGEPREIWDCVCMMDNGEFYISTIEEDGEIGMGIPADMDKIKKIVLKEPFNKSE